MTVASIIAFTEPARAAIMLALVGFCTWSLMSWAFNGGPQGPRLRQASIAVIVLFFSIGVFRTITGVGVTLWPEGPSRVSALADWAERK